MTNQTVKKPILVLGGTGHYGRHIVRSLVGKGDPVRVLSRNATIARQVVGDRPEIIEGDITSFESVRTSLNGATAIVISVSALKWKTIRHIDLIERDSVLKVLEEAPKAGIERVVYLSGYQLREDVIEGLKLHQFARTMQELEAALSKSNLNWTVLGCAPSMELFFAMLRKGAMMVPGGGPPALPTISPVDVGEIAAQAVLRDDLRGERFRLTGPEALSFPEAARRISAVTDRPIKFKRMPLTPIKIAAALMRPFNPFLQHLFWAIKLMNHFPQDIAAEVPAAHQLLLETFDYVPTTLEMEVRHRSEK
ncbi:MAG: NAD(P)H-binding protein [Fidelibacterota bacterium]|nr:MAG: NAD(P)H-binding protein [Candidatus Neomarinimicrobiota bacterium]